MLRVALTISGLCILGWFAWHTRDQLTLLVANCDPWLLMISIILGVLFTSLQALLFASLVGKYGNQAGSRALASAYLVSQPGKYIPGKIWTVLLQSLALDRGTKLWNIAIANIELVLISCIQVTTLGAVLLTISSPMIAALVFIIGLMFSAAVSRSPFAFWLTRLAPSMTNSIRLAVDSNPNHRLGMMRVLWLNSASLAANIIASSCVLLAVGTDVLAADRVPILASIYMGFAVSIIAVPIPAGLGIREAAAAILATVIAPTLSASTIISVAIFFRCWQILVDIGCTLLGAILARRESAPELKS